MGGHLQVAGQENNDTVRIHSHLITQQWIEREVKVHKACTSPPPLPAVGQDEICDKDRKYLDSCVQKLPSLLSRDSIAEIPSSEKAVKQACTTFKTGMQCFDNYAATCLSGEERRVMNSNVAGARHTFSYLCDDPNFRTEYLQHKTCYKKVSRDWDFCVNRFLERVNRSHTKTFDICCANYDLLDCVYEVGVQKCSPDAAKFLRQIAETLANVKVYDAVCRPKGSTLERCSAVFWRPTILVIVISIATGVLGNS